MRHFVHTIKFDTLLPGKARTRAGSNELYCQSKLVSNWLPNTAHYMYMQVPTTCNKQK